VSAVAAVPDQRKGERLILVTQKRGATRSELVTFAKAQHASDLTIPAEVIVVDKLPLLGSGKVDNIAVARMVRDHMAAKTAAAE
jgi:acyl-[acyl-carrier-protein]-phospholipid O-acyltransferase/long-chain-fatty-acid--[acyl-carrier-protein] ligase